jgi:hypothetical protein
MMMQRVGGGWPGHPAARRARGRFCWAWRRPHTRYIFFLLSCDLAMFSMIDQVACSTLRWTFKTIALISYISLLCLLLDHSLLNAHNGVTLLWQMEDQGDRWQPQCLLGSEGHLLMLQGTLVSLSTSSDWSISVLFPNLHMFLVS